MIVKQEFPNLPIKEEEKDQGTNVLFWHICLCVKHEEDEDAEGGSDKVEGKVPQNGSRPVGRRMDSTYKVEMFHLEMEERMVTFSNTGRHLWHSLLDVENDKGSRDEAECEDDADSVGKADPHLPAAVKGN